MSLMPWLGPSVPSTQRTTLLGGKPPSLHPQCAPELTFWNWIPRLGGAALHLELTVTPTPKGQALAAPHPQPLLTPPLCMLPLELSCSLGPWSRK